MRAQINIEYCETKHKKTQGDEKNVKKGGKETFKILSFRRKLSETQGSETKTEVLGLLNIFNCRINTLI